jgi:hypothetical protein
VRALLDSMHAETVITAGVFDRDFSPPCARARGAGWFASTIIACSAQMVTAHSRSSPVFAHHRWDRAARSTPSFAAACTARGRRRWRVWPIGSAHARRQAERYRMSAHLALAPVLDAHADVAAGEFALRQRE